MKLSSLYSTGPYKKFKMNSVQFGNNKNNYIPLKPFQPLNRGRSILARKRTAP
jgi:hypothetical protein